MHGHSHENGHLVIFVVTCSLYYNQDYTKWLHLSLNALVMYVSPQVKSILKASSVVKLGGTEVEIIVRSIDEYFRKVIILCFCNKQSRVEIQHSSVARFDRVTVLEPCINCFVFVPLSTLFLKFVHCFNLTSINLFFCNCYSKRATHVYCELELEVAIEQNFR